jgi:CubicO group peptidase (beta-lactamase class C family)
MNATLIGMLVDEGRLEWDAPVQRYLPQFRLKDEHISPRVTIRDLLTMVTGLPRHDAVWEGSSMDRAELVQRLAHLDLSADFRQRFQYSNLSVTAAGHIAEVVTGQSWEALVRQSICRPLGMRRTSCSLPRTRNITLSYHENSRRQLVPSRACPTGGTGPSGGALYSTVADMCRWIAFNLSGGRVGRRQLIRRKTLAQIHAPQVVIGARPLAGLPAEGTYGLGWLIDSYQGCRRISHSGYLHDVHSSVMLLPDLGIGAVSFINFGPTLLAEVLNQCAFDTLMEFKTGQAFEEKLEQYEKRIVNTRNKRAAVARTRRTRPSQSLSAYSGTYQHPGYGEIRIVHRARKLFLLRRHSRLPLTHWHYDTWTASDRQRRIHQTNAFDETSPIQFRMDEHGRVTSVCVRFEPEVTPICFMKRTRLRTSGR